MQDSFHGLHSAAGKGFNIYFWSSPTIDKKSFLQMDLQGRGYSDLGCDSSSTQNGSPI
jgi:hypothetical protein